MALIRPMVAGDAELEYLLDLPPAEYVAQIAGRVRAWKHVLAKFTLRLRKGGAGISAVGQQTHNSKKTLRWTLHVSSAQHPEMHRVGEGAGHVDIRNHPHERSAALGIIMGSAMTRGDKFM
jgi:hypothetical protein